MTVKNASTMTAEEVRAEIAKLAPQLGKAVNEMGADYDANKITVIEGDALAKAAWVRTANDRLSELRDRDSEIKGYERAASTAEAAEKWLNESTGNPFAPGGEHKPEERKSLGDRLFETGALTERKGQSAEAMWHASEAKADFVTTAGWAPESIRSGRLELSAQRPVQVVDLLPVIDWNQAAYPYMKETTFTNNAAERAEAGSYVEAALALTEVTENIRSIGVFLPMSDEQLADVPSARSYVNARLPFMLRQRLDSQLLVGNGTSPNISGFLDTDRSLNSQAQGGDSVFDAVYKGADKVRTTGYMEPDRIIFHPTDWQALRLQATTEGVYLLGSPAEVGARSLFGTPVTLSSGITQTKVLAGAFEGASALIARQGIEVRVSDSHSDYFAKGKQAVRAGMRVGLAVFREPAFTVITLAS